MSFQKCRTGQTIVIGNNVEVTVVEVKTRQVRVSLQTNPPMRHDRRDGWVEFRKAPEAEHRLAGKGRE